MSFYLTFSKKNIASTLAIIPLTFQYFLTLFSVNRYNLKCDLYHYNSLNMA